MVWLAVWLHVRHTPRLHSAHSLHRGSKVARAPRFEAHAVVNDACTVRVPTANFDGLCKRLLPTALWRRILRTHARTGTNQTHKSQPRSRWWGGERVGGRVGEGWLGHSIATAASCKTPASCARCMKQATNRVLAWLAREQEYIRSRVFHRSLHTTIASARALND